MIEQPNIKLPSVTEGLLVVVDTRATYYPPDTIEDLSVALTPDAWAVDLSLKYWITGARGVIRELITTPTQTIQAGKHWYIFASGDEVWGGYVEDDQAIYDISIDLDTGVITGIDELTIFEY